MDFRSEILMCEGEILDNFCSNFILKIFEKQIFWIINKNKNKYLLYWVYMLE
jgi:hypothetical protein